MTILYININKIDASVSRPENFGGEITVNSSPVIKNLSEKEINVPGITSALLVEFDFNTVYEPKLGQIKISGELLFTDSNSKKIVDEWKKNKKILNDVGVPLMNAIFRRCLTKAIALSEDLQLPPPIVFPTIVHTDDVKIKESKDVKKK
jgi:hypothetical protein